MGNTAQELIARETRPSPLRASGALELFQIGARSP